MGARLHHRGPDDAGVWVDAEAGIALAHRRLSILDLSPAGHQPMVSRSGRYVIAFNGEIYNHLDLRQELERTHFLELSPTSPHPQPLSQRERGAVSLSQPLAQRERGAGVWRGHSDTETLLAAFEAWGIEATLKKSVGMFALALWDRAERRLTLARDRMGEKPLYYGWVKGALVFASEFKAIRAYPGFDNPIERRALALYLRHNYVPAPWSIYANIWKLPPGCYGQFGGQALTPNPSPTGRGDVRVYWSLRAVAEDGLREPFAGSEEEALTKLDRLLKQSLAGQMAARAA